ncbi:MAG: hypothetical protein WA139_02010 [Candidatus Aenigmatarchaeota archaeon]
MFNPFRKKQGLREEQPAAEPYFPPDLERFRVRDEEVPPISSFDIPEKERKFRAFAREMESPEKSVFDDEAAYPRAAKMAKPEREDFFQQKPAGDSDKIDMVLQKLETIDLRLKVIEQKLERRPI